MAQSTGLILTIGAVTITNDVIFNDRQLNWKIPISTGLAALAFGAAETFIGPAIPRGIAMVGLAAVLLTRVNPSVPSPVESAFAWWNKA